MTDGALPLSGVRVVGLSALGPGASGRPTPYFPQGERILGLTGGEMDQLIAEGMLRVEARASV